MRLSVPTTPRRIQPVARREGVLVRVISGSIRIERTAEALFGGEGLPLGASDGAQSWTWPGGDFWIVADGGTAQVEVILP